MQRTDAAGVSSEEGTFTGDGHLKATLFQLSSPLQAGEKIEVLDASTSQLLSSWDVAAAVPQLLALDSYRLVGDGTDTITLSGILLDGTVSAKYQALGSSTTVAITVSSASGDSVEFSFPSLATGRGVFTVSIDRSGLVGSKSWALRVGP